MEFRRLILVIMIITSVTFFHKGPVSLIQTPNVYAQETDDDFDDVEPENIPDPDIDSIMKKEGDISENYYFGGFIKEEVHYGYEREVRKLTKVISTLSLKSSIKFTDDLKFRVSGTGFYDFAYRIDGLENYDDSNLDDNEWEVSLRELLLDFKIDENFIFMIGRQVIAWGESDYSRITDVINPRDMRYPGLTSLEDARLPVTAVRLIYQYKSFNSEAVLVNEHMGSVTGGANADFDSYSSLRLPYVSVADEDEPVSNLKNTGFAVKSTWFFNGGDLSVYIAKNYDDMPVLKAAGIEFSGASLSMLYLTPVFYMYKTFGISGKITKSAVLYKFELAFNEDRRIMTNDFIQRITNGMEAYELETFKTKDQIIYLAGIEYTGLTDLRITLELEDIHTLDYEENLAMDEDDIRCYFQSTLSFLNETLEYDLFFTYFNRGGGNILRLSTSYDIIDNLNIETGVIFYHADSSESILYNFKDQDRVYLRVKYSF